MALTASSMASRIKAAIAAITPVQGTDPAGAIAYSDSVTNAFCQGIIDEFVANAVVTTTSGAPDSEHIGGIT